MPEGTIVVRVIGNASGLAGTMAAAEATVTGSLGKISKAAKPAADGIEQTGKSAKAAHGGISSFAGGFAGLATGLAGFDVAKAVIGDFNTLNQSTAALGSAMKDAGEKQTPAFIDALKHAQSAGEGLGFSAGDTAGALAKLRLGGIDTTRAIAAMPTIMDLAASKHMSLADASVMVIKAMQGSAKGLKDLNIQMPATLPTVAALTTAQHNLATAIAAHGPNSAQAIAAHAKLDDITAKLADRTKNLGTVLDAVAPKVGGQAAAAANTASGRFNVMKTEVMGAATQVLTGMMPAINGAIGVISMLSKHMNIILPIIGAMTLAFIVHKGIVMLTSIQHSILSGWHMVQATSTGVATAAQWLFNAALDANPIALVVIGIGLLIGGFVLLITHVKGVRDVFATVFGAIKTVVGDVIGGIVGVFKGLQDAWNGVIGFFQGMVATVGTVFGKIADAIKNVFLAPFRFIADIWNNSIGKINFTIPGWVPGIGGDSFGFPKVPSFHSGGVVPGTPGTNVLAMLQAGEQVTPAGKGGGINITQYFNTQADPSAIARAVVVALKTRARRSMA